MASWTWESIVLAVVAFVLCCGCQCGCLGVGAASFLEDMKSMKQSEYALLMVQAEPTKSALDEAKDPTVGRLLRHEMRLMLVMPVLAAAAAPWTSCEGGMPSWAYLLYLPFLLRSKVIEFRLLQRLQVNIMDPMVIYEFTMGALEHVDWFTDGAAPIQAAQCEPGATDMWVKAFEVSWAWPFAALVASLRFWGVMLLAFTAAALAQQALGSYGYDGRNLLNHGLAADTAALGAVAAHLAKLAQEKVGAPVSARAAFTSVSKVLLENLVQLFLQATLYAVIFDRLSSAGRFKLLLSMGLGLAAASKKLLELAVGTCRMAIEPNHPEDRFYAILFALIGWIPGLAVTVWVVAKLVFAHKCESHMWNLSTGCVA